MFVRGMEDRNGKRLCPNYFPDYHSPDFSPALAVLYRSTPMSALAAADVAPPGTTPHPSSPPFIIYPL
jgi:hypothetical protein